MLSTTEHKTSRGYEVSVVLNNWLNERQQLWVDYCSIAGLTANKSSESSPLPSNRQLASFCELMMDYVSAGHFEIFDILASEDPNGEALRESLYPQLLKTTDQALEFNDAYGGVEEIINPAMFERAVARLGETLAVRFELEDRIIQHLAERFMPIEVDSLS
ncbi:Rsd/AlgQ family anti-sigma factor [Alteromonas flava]|uniref:Rsd/AlgQ family anti-sigma factor n=1 Tax=Alteromonas flava TaxID=2048003 RepID=UPI000C293285|nr:Rsd/AlgQ family anti-sigma factor [Alteromonas flava]